MDEESNDNIESTNDETEEVLNTDDIEVLADADVSEPEDNSSVEELQKLKESRQRIYDRAKAAEAELKAIKARIPAQTEQPVEKQTGISALDAMALIGAKVTEEEDINEVVEYAKFKGVSVAEALKSSVIKTTLAEKMEQRNTAQATNTGVARRGSSKLSDEQIVANIDAGKFPEDPEALAIARMNLRKSKK